MTNYEWKWTEKLFFFNDINIVTSENVYDLQRLWKNILCFITDLLSLTSVLNTELGYFRLARRLASLSWLIRLQKFIMGVKYGKYSHTDFQSSMNCTIHRSLSFDVLWNSRFLRETNKIGLRGDFVCFSIKMHLNKKTFCLIKIWSYLMIISSFCLSSLL